MGDPAALCGELYPRLVASLRLYLGDLPTAEEIAQDALSRVVERWSEVGRMDYPEAWAWRVAFNLASSSLRRRGAERRAHERLAREAPSPGARAAVETDAATDHLDVDTALRSLPPRQRQAIVLRYYDDLPLADIAEVMGCRAGTVKAHLHKARSALRRHGLTASDDDVSLTPPPTAEGPGHPTSSAHRAGTRSAPEAIASGTDGTDSQTPATVRYARTSTDDDVTDHPAEEHDP